VMWQETSYTIPLIVATAALVISALYLWLCSLLPGAKTAALLLLSGTVWMVGFAVEVLGADLFTKILGDKIQFLTMAVVPVIWLVYVFQFTGIEKWVTRRNVALLSIVPGIVILLGFTNDVHGLVWGNIALTSEEPFILNKSHDVGYWVFMAYSYVLVLFGIFLLIQTLIRSRHLYRQQSKTLLFALFVPLLGGALYLYGVNPLSPFSSLRLAITVITLIMVWGFVRMRLEDIAPMIRGTIIESIGDGIIVLDSQNCIIDMNPSAQHLMECTASEKTGQPIKVVWPGLSGSVESIAHESVTQEIGVDVRGKPRIFDIRISSLFDWRGRISNRVIVVRDITEYRQAEEKIRASLKEKDILLREIHHRVKNNLQIISSLLNLQSTYVRDKRDLEMMKESQDRIRSMALIHEKLYKSESLADIDSREYITDLVRELVRLYGTKGNITLQIEVEDVFLDIDTAIPCGLIINELVSNCLKHAFPGGKSGEILVSLHSVNGKTELVVSDNGVGIPEDMNPLDAESLGLRLVTILAIDQLEGDIRLDRSKGTSFYITFESKRNSREP
jgi:PAS domain S-box-containing protein